MYDRYPERFSDGAERGEADSRPPDPASNQQFQPRLPDDYAQNQQQNLPPAHYPQASQPLPEATYPPAPHQSYQASQPPPQPSAHGQPGFPQQPQSYQEPYPPQPPPSNQPYQEPYQLPPPANYPQASQPLPEATYPPAPHQSYQAPQPPPQPSAHGQLGFPQQPQSYQEPYPPQPPPANQPYQGVPNQTAQPYPPQPPPSYPEPYAQPVEPYPPQPPYPNQGYQEPQPSYPIPTDYYQSPPRGAMTAAPAGYGQAAYPAPGHSLQPAAPVASSYYTPAPNLMPQTRGKAGLMSLMAFGITFGILIVYLLIVPAILIAIMPTSLASDIDRALVIQTISMILVAVPFFFLMQGLKNKLPFKKPKWSDLGWSTLVYVAAKIVAVPFLFFFGGGLGAVLGVATVEGQLTEDFSGSPLLLFGVVAVFGANLGRTCFQRLFLWPTQEVQQTYYSDSHLFHLLRACPY